MLRIDDWRWRLALIVLMAGASCGLTSPAAAQDEPRSAQPTYWRLYENQSEPGAERTEWINRWYGHQLLIVDGVAIASYATGLAVGSAGLLLGSYAAFTLVPPVFHLGHSRDGAALGSLGLRVGVPIGAFYAGAQSCSGFCIDEAYIGLGIGMLVASAVDVAWLAWERVPVKPRVSITPTSVSAGASFAL